MNETQNPLEALRPASPPEELRARVLAAAREAASHEAPGLIDALIGDRLLRACAAALVVLGAASIAIDGEAGGAARPAPRLVSPPAFAADRDEWLPGSTGLTAAEQIDELAPLLGIEIERRRG